MAVPFTRLPARFDFDRFFATRRRESEPTGRDQQSARAILLDALPPGLDGLGDTVWRWYLQGRPLEQILQDVRTTREWKSRYGVIDDLAAKGRALNEGQVIELRRTYVQQMRAAGLKPGFKDDQSSLDNLIRNEVSPVEFGGRLREYQVLAFESPVEDREEFARFGYDAGDLLAVVMDPKVALPLLQQRVAAAQIGGASRRAGAGVLTREEAERLAAVGVDPDAAATGFSQVAELGELTTALPGEEGALDRATLLGAVFEGDADDRRRVEDEAARRRSQFQGGGGFARGRGGVTGIGPAR